jgi:hypothetical protein
LVIFDDKEFVFRESSVSGFLLRVKGQFSEDSLRADRRLTIPNLSGRQAERSL